MPDEANGTPGPTTYDPQHPVGFKAAAAAFKSTTVRLPEGNSDSQPCTAYDPKQESSKGALAAVWSRCEARIPFCASVRLQPIMKSLLPCCDISFPPVIPEVSMHKYFFLQTAFHPTLYTFPTRLRSTSPRLPEDKADSPPSTAYSPEAPKGYQGVSAAFRSASARLPEYKSESPGVGAYSPEVSSPGQTSVCRRSHFEGGIGSVGRQGTIEPQGVLAVARPPIAQGAPSSGLVGQQKAGPSRPQPSSAFASASARLPEYKSDAPPPTAYNPKAPEGHQSWSAAFRSTTERLPDPKSDAPPPNAYDPTHGPPCDRLIWVKPIRA